MKTTGFGDAIQKTTQDSMWLQVQVLRVRLDRCLWKLSILQHDLFTQTQIVLSAKPSPQLPSTESSLEHGSSKARVIAWPLPERSSTLCSTMTLSETKHEK